MARPGRSRGEIVPPRDREVGAPHPSSVESRDGDSTTYFGIQYSGPLPPPAMLRGYDDVLPGAADRIVSLVERQQEHRHAMETQHLVGSQRAETRGMIAAVAIAVFVSGGGMVLAWNGRELAGLVSVIAPLTALVSVFVIGRLKQSADQSAKRAEIDKALAPKRTTRTKR